MSKIQNKQIITSIREELPTAFTKGAKFHWTVFTRDPTAYSNGMQLPPCVTTTLLFHSVPRPPYQVTAVSRYCSSLRLSVVRRSRVHSSHLALQKELRRFKSYIQFSLAAILMRVLRRGVQVCDEIYTSVPGTVSRGRTLGGHGTAIKRGDRENSNSHGGFERQPTKTEDEEFTD